MTRALTCVFTASNSPYLSAECTGLGNVLFQIAAVYGVAKETGRTVELIDLKNFTSKLKSLTGIDYTTTIFRNLPIHSDSEYTMRCDVNHHYTGDFKQELVDFVNNSIHNICLNGHFESPLFFSSCETEMKKMFSPDQESFPPLSHSTQQLPRIRNCKPHCARQEGTLPPGHGGAHQPPAFHREYPLAREPSNLNRLRE